ncbi:MAG: radical SAM protein [Mariprofundaceae bacterium]|nr:radical SAM protein [Mariprofundaceae bacterium]
MINIHEIYQSIQGESTLAGVPCTFIRLAGCPLRCTYCDTLQAIPFDSGSAMGMDDVLTQVAIWESPLVLVTGGEPLVQKNCLLLLQKLLDTGVTVQLETSGALSIKSVPVAVRKIMDIKTPGSGEEQRNHWQNIQHLHAHDEIKFVLKDQLDYEWCRQIIHERLKDTSATILLSPCWGQLNAEDLCAWILQDKLPVRMQLQMHKVIWGAEKTGV